MAAKPYRTAEYQTNRRLLLAANPLCAICGIEPATQADHVVPLCEGVDHSLANLRPACRSCNAKRGASIGYQRMRELQRQRFAEAVAQAVEDELARRAQWEARRAPQPAFVRW